MGGFGAHGRVVHNGGLCMESILLPNTGTFHWFNIKAYHICKAISNIAIQYNHGTTTDLKKMKRKKPFENWNFGKLLLREKQFIVQSLDMYLIRNIMFRSNQVFLSTVGILFRRLTADHLDISINMLDMSALMNMVLYSKSPSEGLTT